MCAGGVYVGSMCVCGGVCVMFVWWDMCVCGGICVVRVCVCWWWCVCVAECM